MNSFMNIQVRVLSAAARGQLKALQAQLAATSAATTGASGANAAFSGSLHRGLRSLSKWGNQVQWTGRQLQRNWTLPLLLAGGAAVKWAMDNEKAFTHTKKVYGDLSAAQAFFLKNQSKIPEGMNAASAAAATMESELDSLKDAFEAISEHYGVQLKQVNEVAGAWAAAGTSGIDLAKSVNLTMKAIMLGNMDATAATKALIAIQAQFDLKTKETGAALSYLNAIENQTGIELSGLIEGFRRASGVARASGVGIRELGAELAALVPAAGEAGAAGNALKTIYSRLLAPTGDTQDIIKALGIQMKDQAWLSANAADRLKILATRFKELSDTEVANAASVVGSRWQYNKLVILLDEMTKKTGFYQKALDATKDRQDVFRQATDELNAILDSSPNKFQRMWVTIQNGMANAVIPLIPYLLYMFNLIREGVDAFQNLDPATQKFILFAAAALAIMPILTVYLGSFTTLIGTLGAAFTWVIPRAFGATKAVAAFTRFLLLTPVKFAIGALAGIGAGFIVLGKTIWNFAAMQKAFLGAQAAFHAAWLAITNGFWSLMVAGWIAGYKALAAVGRSSMLVGNFVLILGAMSTAAKFWFGKMAMALMKFGAAYDLIFIGMWTRMRFAMVAFIEWMILQWRLAATSISLVWVGMYKSLTAASAVGGKALTALWAVTTSGIQKVVYIGGTYILRTWLGIQAAMAAASRIFWTEMIRIWIAGMTALVALPGRLLLAFKALGPLLLRIGPTLLRAITGPIGLAVAAGLGLLYAFRNQIAGLWNNIVTYFSDSSNGMVKAVLAAWYSLPNGVRSALEAVARIVYNAAMAIYEMFSYINPFAHHSPSLVENVTRGVAEVNKQFKNLSVGSSISQAYAEIKRFGQLTAQLGVSAQAADRAEDRKTLKGVSPAALGSYNKLVRLLDILTPKLKAAQAVVDAQQQVVNKWEDALKKANDALDIQAKKLSDLQDVADGWKDKLDAAQEQLSYFANAPIQGMKAAEDAIFENEMAQKSLRLEMMKIEQVTGPLDEIKSKMEAIAGAQELLRGEKSSLQSAGAGSEVLKGYQDQIDALDAQKKAYQDAAAPLNDLQSQLDKLQTQAEMMDLEKSLKFDPLTHQIEAAANAMKELPFDEIMAGITAAQDDISKYTDKWTAATDAVKAQQAVVDSLTKNRDKIQSSLDKEQDKLDGLKQSYDRINDAVQAINQSLQDVLSNADKLSSKDKFGGGKEHISPALQAFMDAKGGNFPDVGGTGNAIRTNWESQSKQIDKFTEDLQNSTADMFKDLNPFSPLKKKWHAFTAWLSQRVSDFKAGFSDMFSSITGGGEGLQSAGDKMSIFWEKTKEAFSKVGKIVRSVWKLFGPEVKKTLKSTGELLVEMWKKVGPELVKFKRLLEPLWKIFKKVILPILAVVALALLGVGKVLWAMFNGAFKPVISGIISIIKGLLEVFRGVFEVILGVLTGDWKLAWQGVSDIVHGTLDTIVGLFKGVFGGAIGLVKGFVKGVVGFFHWLWDVLVGHSIVPDTVKAIFFWFKKLGKLAMWIWNNVLQPIWRFFVKLWNLVRPFVATWVTGIKNILRGLFTLGRWFFDNILKPVFTSVVSVWKNYIRPELGAWGQRFKNVWHGLTLLGKWVKENVMDPVFDRIKDGWKGIRDWMNNNTDFLKKPVAGIVNIVVDAINLLIKGLNKISDILPGIDFEIDLVPQLAAGGGIPKRRVGSGFKTNGARAIVGEGKANYPEFVIPTDPTHRRRALGLLTDAASRMGADARSGILGDTPKDIAKINAGGTPAYSIGGTLGDIWKGATSGVKNAWKFVKKNAVNAAWAPFGFAAHKMMNGVHWNVAKGLGNYGIDQVESWVKGANDAANKQVIKSGADSPAMKRAKDFAKAQEGKPYVWGGVGPDGYDCSGFMSALTNVLQGKSPYSRRGTTASFPWAGFDPGANTDGFTIGSSPSYRGGVGHMAGTLNGLNVESRGGVGVITGPSARGYMDAGFSSIAHIAKLKNGGIIKSRPGGIVANIGEGRYDEAVVPLTSNWNKPGETHLHFHGDLVFPNISSPEDAKTFIKNLEILAETA